MWYKHIVSLSDHNVGKKVLRWLIAVPTVPSWTPEGWPISMPISGAGESLSPPSAPQVSATLYFVAISRSHAYLLVVLEVKHLIMFFLCICVPSGNTFLHSGFFICKLLNWWIDPNPRQTLNFISSRLWLEEGEPVRGERLLLQPHRPQRVRQDPAGLGFGFA